MDVDLLEEYEKILAVDNLINMDARHFNYFMGGLVKNCMEFIETTENHDSVYYTVMNIVGLNIPNPIKYKIMTEVMKSPKMRTIIWEKSLGEISESLGESLGITDPELIEDLRDDLLGPDFLMLGYKANRDWTGFVEKIQPFVEQKINSVEDSENIIFWSNRNTSELNENYTTIENATIGDKMFFLEGLVFINWQSESSQIPMFSTFWEELSEMYTKTVLTRLEKEEKTTLTFHTTPDAKDGVRYGAIFKNVEFPLILESNIDTINIKVNDGNEYALNISPLKEQYQSMRTTYENKLLVPMINEELIKETKLLIGGEKAYG